VNHIGDGDIRHRSIFNNEGPKGKSDIEQNTSTPNKLTEKRKIVFSRPNEGARTDIVTLVSKQTGHGLTKVGRNEH
jgi:hypothetical protein